MALSGEPLKDPQHEASASATIDSPLCKPPAQQCPGELQLVGTQCKCPENTRRTADDHCRGATPTPPTPVPSACPAGTQGTYPNCTRIVVPRCPPDTRG